MQFFQRIELLFLCFGLLISGTARATEPVAHGQLKVLELNFNSEEVPNDSNYLVRDLRFHGLVEWIQENSPDVIFLEEAWSYRHDHSVAFALAREIGYDLAYRLEMGLPDFFYEADAVLAKKEMRMTDERNLKLPHSAIEIGDGKTWIIELGAVSYAVGVKLTLADGSPLYSYATHLTGASAADRADQASAILEDARSRVEKDGMDWRQSHVLLGGDFNSAPSEPAPNAITDAGFLDSFATMHPGDGSCSDCERPDQPWFNPFTLAAGLVPSQAASNSELRDDYIFIHSPDLRPLASTLVFTSPYHGVWMSDHYGVMSVFGDGSAPLPPNPSHDTSGRLPDSRIVTLTNDQFRCSNPNSWCQISNPLLTVHGARGLTIQNQTSFYVDFAIHGPGTIFATRRAGLNPGERASFTFNTSGEFQYTIRNDYPLLNAYKAEITGAVWVEETGY